MRRKWTTTRIVLLVVSAVMVVCGFGAAAAFGLFNSLAGAVKPAKAATAAYLDDLRDGDYDGAYAQLCSGTRGRVTPAQFRAGEQPRGRLTGYEIVGVNVFNRNGRTTATVTVNLRFDRGFADGQRIVLVKEDGAWRVCDRSP